MSLRQDREVLGIEIRTCAGVPEDGAILYGQWDRGWCHVGALLPDRGGVVSGWMKFDADGTPREFVHGNTHPLDREQP